MSLTNKAILIYIAFGILLAQLNPGGESLGTQPVVAVLRTNNLYHPDPHLERAYINLILKYLKPVYRTRKTTHTNVEIGPGSFKETHVKLPQEHLYKQFKKLLQRKEKMENKA